MNLSDYPAMESANSFKASSGQTGEVFFIDMPDQLQQRIDFIKAIDALKDVQRKTYLLSESRFENSAEHSWAVGSRRKG